MNDEHIQFLAVPSITMPNTWVGIVVNRRTGTIHRQTLVTYRSSDEARFGARRSWVTFRRNVERNLQELA